MLELTQWWAKFAGADETWLILGKGPSFENRHEFDLTGFKTLGLNHVVQDMAVDVASVMDIEVIRTAGETIDRNAGFLLMPRYPHVDFKPARRTLDTFLADYPILEKLAREGRLIWYNYDADRAPAPSSPLIPHGHFSGEVMVNLLAVLEVKTIRTLGVDGGRTYAAGFDEGTRLANRQADFDVQWAGITATVQSHGIDYAPLGMEVPVRVYIGTDESQLIGAKVLEYTIRKHCPVAVEFDYMMHVRAPRPKLHENRPRTLFSFNRFAIPKLAGYRGRAIYLDADMQVFRNFLELWNLPFDGAAVLSAPSSNPARWADQHSVLLLDCGCLTWDLKAIIAAMDAGEFDYRQLLEDICIEPPELIRRTIPSDWNSLEEYQPGRTGLVHYTNMLTQPWVNARNPIGDLWVAALKAAIDDGFISWDEVEQAVAKGHARPSLIRQLSIRKEYWRPFRLVIAPFLDFGYRPHKKLRASLRKSRPEDAQPQSGVEKAL